MLKKCIEYVLVPMLAPISGAIGSKLATGNWLEWLSQLPTWLYVVYITVLIFVAIIYRYISVAEYNCQNQLGYSSAGVLGRIVVGDFEYKGMKWRIERQDLPEFVIGNSVNFRPEAIVIVPPFCKKCKIEIKQNMQFFGKYRYFCIKCGFEKNNNNDMYLECDNVRILAQAELDKKQFGN